VLYEQLTSMDRLGLPLLLLALGLALIIVMGLLARRFSQALRTPIEAARRLITRVQQLELVPKVKLLFTFYQLASTLPSVYNVKLPKIYHDSVAMFSWVSLDWDNYVFPGQCIESGFRRRLMLRALAPLVLICGIPLCALLYFYFRYRQGRRNDWAAPALGASLPVVLLATFCLCPGVSKGIFASWDCIGYELDSDSVRSFLSEDLTIVCYSEEHEQQIARLAVVFVFLWPLGMPLLYLAVLIPNRSALRQRRKTSMVKATNFLHKEYVTLYYWWEVLPLVQRLVLTGAVLLVPVENDKWRIFLGLLVVVGYLTLLQFVQPCACLSA
jgi:hypothetical protein